MKLKTIKSDTTINNYIDSETGEVLETESSIKRSTIVLTSKEDFVLMFTETMGLVDGLDKVAIKVIQWCALNAKYNDNSISLNKYYREVICNKFSLTDGTIRNAISRLKKKNILIPLGGGVYRINPRYYWKGDSKKRKEVMKFILEVECQNC